MESKLFMLVFEQRGKLEYLWENLSEPSREPTYMYGIKSGNRYPGPHWRKASALTTITVDAVMCRLSIHQPYKVNNKQ